MVWGYNMSPTKRKITSLYQHHGFLAETLHTPYNALVIKRTDVTGILIYWEDVKPIKPPSHSEEKQDSLRPMEPQETAGNIISGRKELPRSYNSLFKASPEIQSEFCTKVYFIRNSLISVNIPWMCKRVIDLKEIIRTWFNFLSRIWWVMIQLPKIIISEANLNPQ